MFHITDLFMIFALFFLLLMLTDIAMRKNLTDVAVEGVGGVFFDAFNNVAKLMQTSVSEYMEVGLPGQLADNGPHDVVSRINSSGGVIPFGVFVTKGSAQGTAVPPDASTEITGPGGIGVALRTHSIVKDTGYVDKASMSVIKKGRVSVLVEDAVVAESQAFVRFVATGEEQLGAFRSDADGTDAVALPGAKFVTDAQAGELAMLDINLP